MKQKLGFGIALVLGLSAITIFSFFGRADDLALETKAWKCIEDLNSYEGTTRNSGSGTVDFPVTIIADTDRSGREGFWIYTDSMTYWADASWTKRSSPYYKVLIPNKHRSVYFIGEKNGEVRPFPSGANTDNQVIAKERVGDESRTALMDFVQSRISSLPGASPGTSFFRAPEGSEAYRRAGLAMAAGMSCKEIPHRKIMESAARVVSEYHRTFQSAPAEKSPIAPTPAGEVVK